MALQNHTARETRTGAGRRRGSGICGRRPSHPGGAFSSSATVRLDRPNAGRGRVVPDCQTAKVSAGAVLCRKEHLESAVDASALGSRDVLFPTGGVEYVAEPVSILTVGHGGDRMGQTSPKFASEVEDKD